MLTTIKRDGRREPLDISSIQEYTSSILRSLKCESYKKLTPLAEKILDNVTDSIDSLLKVNIKDNESTEKIRKLLDYLSNNPEFLMYFKRWERDTKTGKFYNHSLYEMLKAIYVMEHAYTFLKKSYSNEWRRCRHAIKKLYLENNRLGISVAPIKSLMDFAYSFEPKQINQYMAKVMKGAGMTIDAIQAAFKSIGGMSRITDKILNKIKLPKLPYAFYTLA